MGIRMCLCFRSFGLRPQDDKGPLGMEDKGPLGMTRAVILSAAKNLNAGPVILSEAKNLNRKILPLFIHRINQCILTFTFPSFQLFLSGDCLVNI